MKTYEITAMGEWSKHFKIRANSPEEAKKKLNHKIEKLFFSKRFPLDTAEVIQVEWENSERPKKSADDEWDRAHGN